MFSYTRIALICRAPIENITRIKGRISSFPLLIAVDGGISHCFKLGLRPDLIIGDFDSVDPAMLKHFVNVAEKHYPKDKDKTDLEIALELVYHSQSVFPMKQSETR